MGKASKPEKKRIPVSFKCDPDLHADAVKKILRERLATGKTITLSGKIEDLLRAWTYPLKDR